MKNFVIFGDSYSTHKDCIPSGYLHYYCIEGRADKGEQTKMFPEQTWWGRLIEETGARLVLNDSWSGSTVSYSGYDGDCSTTSSFIYRYRKQRESELMRGANIDTIFVFGATNDSWADSPLGELKFKDWEEKDLFYVLPAICYLMDAMRRDFPKARIIFISNYGIKSEITEGIEIASRKIGVEHLRLDEVDKISKHPTVLGMKQICDQVLKKIKEQ